MNKMTAIINIIAWIVFAAGCVSAAVKHLHMAQLEGYKPKQYWHWLSHNLNISFLKELAVLAATFILVFTAYIIHYPQFLLYLLLIIWSASNIYIIYKLNTTKGAKKSLVFTHRATRLFVLNLLFLMLWSAFGFIYLSGSFEFILYLSLLRLAVPFNMLFSMEVIYPVEIMIQQRYMRMAKAKLNGMKNLKVIGITGSYGKTSTKYFLKTILSEKYNTLMTPESYNTPMGITKVIREQLANEHQVFVCEMGARNIGDIKTLCKLVNPTMGILTSIGPQHLETFKSIDNVVKTKYELIQALPYYGTAIFNGDNSYCLKLARKTGIDTMVYSMNRNDEDIYLKAENVKYTREGLEFLVKGQDDIEFECRTRLLGRHNVSNILAAICAAIRLGLSTDEIIRGISKIEPVPHRLQLMDTNNGITVIDDAFNSNPVGSKEALEILKGFTGGSRIIITPGMVELGAIEYEENKKFGKFMAECCDYAILVGIKRSRPIIEGLMQGKFPEQRIIAVSSLNEATERLGHIVKPGDVVLFENDLPDNYTE